MEAEQVLPRVWEETKTPLVVYATERALEAAADALPAALERFARAENKAFRQELSREAAAEAAGGAGRLSLGSLSPSKRKHRADTPDSMDSNRASVGSCDEGEGAGAGMVGTAGVERAADEARRAPGMEGEARRAPEMQERARTPSFMAAAAAAAAKDGDADGDADMAAEQE